MLLGSIGFLPMMLLIFACHMFMPFSSIRSFHLPFHPLLIPLFHFIFSSMMRRPRRTSLRTFRTVVFIRNAKSFCRISPILLYLKSFRLGDRSPSVGNTRDVQSCSFRSFTPTCIALIPLCLVLLPHSEVYVLQLLRILYLRYYMFSAS